MFRFKPLIFAALTGLLGSASAQVGGTLTDTLKTPAFSGYKVTGTVLTAPNGTTVTLTTLGALPGVRYLDSARVLLPTLDTAQAGLLLSALTGEDLSAPLTDYLSHPEVQARLTAGVEVAADPYTLALKTVGQGLSLTVSLAQYSGFGPVPVSRVLGNPAAPLVIRMYSDLQCPYCQKAELEALPTVLKNLPKDVRFEFHHVPLEHLHPNARAAAEASVCAANQGRFYPFKDALFWRDYWQKQPNPAAIFETVAQGTGLNIQTYRAGRDARQGRAEVDAGLAEAEKVGIEGTPTVFIGSYQVADPYDATSYLRLLDFVRAK